MAVFLDDAITDIYIPASDSRRAFSFPDKKPIPEAMAPFVEGLLNVCQSVPRKVFSVTHEGAKFRVQKNDTFEGPLYCLRRMANSVRSLPECGLNPRLQEIMMADRLCRGGLVVVSGSPGNGKSTTCAAMIRQRLQKFGGICFTVEDPVELPLQGDHGPGFCMQHQVDNLESFPEAMRDALRSYPTQVENMMMLVGEVRDAETAALVLQAAVDGRLVLTTLHAASVVDATYRMLSLAAKILGSDEARNLMSASLRLMIHQRLKRREGLVEPLPQCEILFDTHQVASKIRTRGTQLTLLEDDIRFQQNLMFKQMPLQMREV